VPLHISALSDKLFPSHKDRTTKPGHVPTLFSDYFLTEILLREEGINVDEAHVFSWWYGRKAMEGYTHEITKQLNLIDILTKNTERDKSYSVDEKFLLSYQ
jgi:hypothetical protein